MEKIEDVADDFVRLRLTRIDELDLNLFEFDYDLTFIVFFMDAEDKVYARYGGRDAEDADNRQSLAGLRYTMLSVLGDHESEHKEFAPKSQETSRYLRDASGPRFGRGGCLHCHQVKERLNSDLRRAGKWTRENVWRYPLPENIGLTLDVDRGNFIKNVEADSPASKAGLKAGDTLGRLHGVPIHSFADTQYALDRAPEAGEIDVLWRQGDKLQKGKLSLPDGWRKTDISWRASMRQMVPSPRFYGPNLKPEEKKALGLSPKQLAFRQADYLSKVLIAAGFRAGDVILGVDGKSFETDCEGFRRYVQQNYLVGDRVTVNLLRDGKRQSIPMVLQP